jgi:hydrogenase nickel incorporation protein HypA/HybF
MHELAVTESILNIATKHAVQSGAKRVTDIHLVIGALASIVDDSVQFYWDFITENSLCAGAKLHFKRIPAELNCLSCNHRYQLNGLLSACPNCGSAQVKVVSGEEFYLESIEIER